MSAGAPAAQAFAAALQAHRQGQFAQAETLTRALLDQDPGHVEGWALLGEILLRRGANAAQAVEAYERALALRPHWPQLQFNLGTVLLGSGRHPQAQGHYRAVLAADPRHRDARLNLARSLASTGDLEGAAGELETLTSQHPEFAPAWVALSALHLRRRHLDAAVRCAEHAVRADPDSGSARHQLGTSLCRVGRAPEARAHFDRAFELSPGDRDVRSGRLLMLNYLPDLPVQELVRAHRREGARVAEDAGPPMPLPDRPASKETRIRVGYVSPDIVGHAVSEFLTPVLSGHDRNLVSLHAYDTKPVRAHQPEGAKRLFDQWRACGAMTDAQLAQQIRADDIDVLIDLTGQTANARPGVFARRPARVHWQWFGYPLLSGLDAFDARLTDAWLDPPGRNPGGEQLAYLPSRLLWRMSEAVPVAMETPALRGNPFTFGSFNGLVKMHPALLDAWIAILAAAPGSRLRLGHMDSQDFEQRLRQRMQAAGVDPRRLEVLPKLPLRDYLAAHQDIDLMLDSFPYNGGTTTAHALWQGVPVVSLAGEYGVQRLGAAFLQQLGLEELLASSVDEYVARAIALAGQPDQLGAWRASLRDRFRAAPIGQPRMVMAELERLMAEALGR